MTFTGELGHGLLILCCCPFYLPPALRAPILLYLVMPSGPGLLSPHARISLFGLCNIYIKGLSHDYSFIIYLRWSQIHVNLLCWSVNPDPLPPMPQTHKQKFNFLITLFEFRYNLCLSKFTCLDGAIWGNFGWLAVVKSLRIQSRWYVG